MSTVQVQINLRIPNQFESLFPVVTGTEVVNVPERRTSARAKKAPDRLIESM